MIKHFTVDGAKYACVDGMRLTDCCASRSTYSGDGVLFCKKCGREVKIGQGDGNEYFEKKPTRVAYRYSSKPGDPKARR